MDGTADRLESLRELVWERLRSLENGQEMQALQHLSCVSDLCSLLALKRGLEVGVCRCAGLLHDLWMYCNFPMTPEVHERHGEYGAVEARKILEEAGGYGEGEIRMICAMIHNHNDKDILQDQYNELLKDADALAHFLRNAEYDRRYRYHSRHEQVLRELGITVPRPE